MMEIFNEELKSKAAKIKFFFSDVDGTLTDGTSYYSEKGEIMKRFNFTDGTGFYLLSKLNIAGGIITGENSPIVSRRSEKLKLDYCYLNVSDKLLFMQNFVAEHNVSLENIAYIGDDLNDLKLLANAGLTFCPKNAHDLVKEIVDIICKRNGGDGAFREAVEILYHLRNSDILESFYK